MAQRHSTYERKPHEEYITPDWVWQTLFELEPWAAGALDPCTNERFLEKGIDFLEDHTPRAMIATNPPFSLSNEMVRHAIRVTHPSRGICAFLLPVTWDCAKGRRELFGPLFKCKYILTRRIQWDNLEHKATPSSNHAWYVWDWRNDGPNRQMRVI